MNIGSKIRLLHGREEGVITKIGSGKFVEVDLGDGFSIPVLASEIVLISPMEARLEPSSKSPEISRHTVVARSQPFATHGIYFAFVPVNDREIVLHLINLTDWKVAFSIFGRKEGRLTGIACDMLEKSQSRQISRLLFKDFDSWPVFETTLLLYSDQRAPEEPVLRHTLRCRIQRFHKQLQKAPLLNTNAHVFQIDPDSPNPPDAKMTPVAAESIRDKMLEKNDDPVSRTAFPGRLPSRIDLHTEALSENTEGMSPAEILSVQLSAFKTYLERSIAEGLEDITIIHGAGQGTLRKEIHRTLSKHPNVAYYKDAQKEKFGYGATIARLK